MNTLHAVLLPLAETSLRVSLLLIPLLLRPWLRRAIGSPWLCLLWLVILVRLLVLLSIESPWSLAACWPKKVAAPAAGQAVQARVMLPGVR